MVSRVGKLMDCVAQKVAVMKLKNSQAFEMIDVMYCSRWLLNTFLVIIRLLRLEVLKRIRKILKHNLSET